MNKSANSGKYRSALGIALVVLYASAGLGRAGTWQRVTISGGPPGGGTALLLTDGTVMVHQGCTPNWFKLTPDTFGNYVTGTWSPIASMQSTYGPLYYASAVLADGRVVVIGGEFNSQDGCSSLVETNQGAVYNPKTNTWAVLPPPPGASNIGDAPSVVLFNGKFLLGIVPSGTAIAQLNPATLTWDFVIAGSVVGKADDNSEEGWTLLPDGTVLTVDTRNGTHSERYIPSTGQWVSAGSTIVPLSIGSEIGPAVLRPDGTVFATGPTGHTAIYNVASGTWVVGPDFPNIPGRGQLAVFDGPAALLPNGNVLCAVSPGGNPPTYFFEFDGTNLRPVAAIPNASIETPFTERMLLLPTGQVLLTDGSADVEIYTPTGTFNPAWAPTIISAPASVGPGNTYTISGTQFNGLSQAVAYGDDAQAATNYPLVRITNHATGHVFYCRTHDHSTMAVATGAATVSTRFDVPNNIEPGLSDLIVVANGIPSSPRVVNVQTNLITVAIDVKPGEDPPRINPTANGKTPVAILSGPAFNAVTQTDTTSLTFGRTGDEASLAFCSGAEDVNRDHLPDLVCHFTTNLTGLRPGDTLAILKGKTVTGVPLQGTDSVVIIGK